MSLKARHKKITTNTRELIYQKYNGRCGYCGCELMYKDMQVDHIIPKYSEERTGVDTDVIENYMPACRMCNFYKGTMDVENFRKQICLLLERLEKVFIYRMARKYSLVVTWPQDIVFYFENRNGRGGKHGKI